MVLDTETEASTTERLGVLTRSCQMRVLNCSVSGCLIETNFKVDVGAVASIRVVINGRELGDDVQVVRCQPIAGAGSVYHIGAQFLWTTPPGENSLRAALWEPTSGARDDISRTSLRIPKCSPD